MAAARVAWLRAAGCAAVCALAAVVALELAARGAPEEEPAALAGGAWPPRVVAGSMLAGWGSRLPGVSRLARAHVHEFGTHKFHDGDGLWQSGGPGPALRAPAPCCVCVCVCVCVRACVRAFVLAH